MRVECVCVCAHRGASLHNGTLGWGCVNTVITHMYGSFVMKFVAL